LTVGQYDDGSPGELFITMSKEGSTIGGLMDSLGTAISVALQYGVPIESLVTKFAHQRFEPMGMTTNHDIPFAKSLVDYIFRYLASRFLSADLKEKVGVVLREGTQAPSVASSLTDTTGSFPRVIAIQGGGELQPVHPSVAAPIAAAFTTEASQAEHRSIGFQPVPATGQASTASSQLAFQNSADAPSCHECGSLMVRGGACYKCLNCGATSGCS
jgi:ribonucleoside-diphosphate reductase alpha chain